MSRYPVATVWTAVVFALLSTSACRLDDSHLPPPPIATDPGGRGGTPAPIGGSGGQSGGVAGTDVRPFDGALDVGRVETSASPGVSSADGAPAQVDLRPVDRPVDLANEVEPVMPPTVDLAPSPVEVAPPIADCQVSEWSAWSACSKACAGGKQSRGRTIVVAPTQGGKACPHLQESRDCNTQAPNGCGGCKPLAVAIGEACGACGKTACGGVDEVVCQQAPAKTCRDLGAVCGTPSDGCGGQLSCGGCADALTSCSATFACACARPTAIYSPSGDLDSGKRAASPDGNWVATSEGIFTVGGQRVAQLPDVKAFDWHPRVPNRFAVMRHFSPPRDRAEITVHDIGPGGMQPLAIARSDDWHHYMAWIDGDRIALGGSGTCVTVRTVTPARPETTTDTPDAAGF